MRNATPPSLSSRFANRSPLAALGIRWRQRNLFGPVKAQLPMAQKVVTHPPIHKG